MSINQIRFLSLIYASVTYILAEISKSGIPDRDAYLNFYARAYDYLSIRWDEGYLVFFSNEPLWTLLNYYLKNTFSNYSDTVVLSVLIFISSYIFCNSILRLVSDKKTIAYVLFIFLFSDPIIKNFIAHIRQGFAMSIFFYALNFRSFFPRISLIVSTTMIHSTFMLIIINYIYNFFSKKTVPGLRVFIYAIMANILVLSFYILLEFLKARQLSALSVPQDLSMNGFIFWFFILLLFMLQNRQFYRENIQSYYILVFYLNSYFLINYSARFLESLLPLILISGLNLSGNYRNIFIAAYSFLSIYLFLFGELFLIYIF